MPGRGCTGLDNLKTDFTKNGFRLPAESEWEFASARVQNVRPCHRDDFTPGDWHGNTGVRVVLPAGP